ncbi:UDP-N-acetyl-D-mannosamine dehydrogenase [Burkholderia ambifaria]|jgi:UDP-N-acetyl-D-mannosaminuronic acid dehydrogenase|uniref:NDP-N-acetyl-D-galactosaminuronic acid dehydrogenase n=1 Tax=Burkholderia ambifaria (strain MC40-6) TaxID=398577 RepID=B1Z0Y3_BURA4|nr:MULTISPECIES: UDP-N-acetyl-D-mannosamine dehydrogenase [Burkholderia]ACB66163.1 nucleotide sugar dehydrogenase [Burkholderia ambifaria MC40-6]MBR8066886.1 UDP-N-acetyl-D-mannosamine dehydrogenase [Burkholderia ambifaria]MBR8253788.1 UDP-N-acetyl-D-mannosamine dehydrogenase [Burkholderia ambifaria]MBY4765873.1 UDP-N-acetyl-D-mannosamine dehydrogenase [Burkholderia ambifaria]QDW53736.1 UDP-N-acetyl-D-mannosamine dehydrogenase [Burkholderia sp. KBS0801]
MSFDVISVIGLGYIGLPTAAAFAARRKSVVGVDVNRATVDTINRGEVHIVEPELDMLVRAAVTQGHLRATDTVEPADAFLIAVPTPFAAGHKPDLTYVEAASRAIGPVLKKGDLIVLESTSPVGTTEKIAAWLAAMRPDLTFPQQAGEQSDIRIAHCPERVLPGHVIRELVENDRVIGGMTRRCSELAAELYRVFVRGECVLTDARTAEMCKLTENSFRDVNIAFANELSVICESLDINVWELIRLSNRHPRVDILQPGPGVGGHCIAVDPWFIVDSAPEHARLIRTARTVNDDKPNYVLDRIEHVAKRFREPVIACLGLAFKADIDDLRESPAVGIVRELANREVGQVIAVEPNIRQLPASLEGRVMLGEIADALARADIVVILVDHRQFKRIDPMKLHTKIVIDTRGLLARERQVA